MNRRERRKAPYADTFLSTRRVPPSGCYHLMAEPNTVEVPEDALKDVLRFVETEAASAYIPDDSELLEAVEDLKGEIETLTLHVDDNPTVEVGDELLIFPDKGGSYTADVVATDLDRAKISIPPSGSGPRPVGRRERWLDREELEAWVATSDCLINPDEGDPADPNMVEDGGRYGPYERANARREVHNNRVARRRAGRRF